MDYHWYFKMKGIEIGLTNSSQDYLLNIQNEIIKLVCTLNLDMKSNFPFEWNNAFQEGVDFGKSLKTLSLDGFDCPISVLFNLYTYYLAKGKDCFCGRTRNVIDLGSWVVKLPKTEVGILDNLQEHDTGSYFRIVNMKNLDIVQYPKTRLVAIAKYKYIPILFMEKVTLIKDTYNLPNWVDQIDGRQVGYTKDGRLVAYDYGRN
jgi:hypothetical protein